MAQLDIETRDGTRTIALDRDRLSIGRLSFNDVVLPYPQVSRQHAELRRIGGQWWIADLHSTNGLQVNSRRVQEHALDSGDRVVLAPGVSLRFVASAEETGEAPVQPAHTSASAQRSPSSRPDWAERAALPVGARDDPQSMRPTVGPAPGQPYLPLEAIPSPRSRSVFADDAAPIVPPGGATGGPLARHPRRASLGPETAAAAPPPFGAWSEPASGKLLSGGSPAPRGPLSAGPEPASADAFQGVGVRKGRAGPPTSRPAKLLHVCQTCGQLTAPDAVYCQTCHQAIAHECANCRLSLLPIQDRCPRCHTANQHSVRRARPDGGA